MKVGFTSTREGLTCKQHKSLASLLVEIGMTEFHLGCCVGGDEEAGDIVICLLADRVIDCRIVGHPPTNGKLVSRWATYVCHVMLPPEPYLIRNARIVDDTTKLIACPKGDEELRSGTWATIRYARKCRKPVTIIWPDGSVENDAA